MRSKFHADSWANRVYSYSTGDVSEAFLQSTAAVPWSYRSAGTSEGGHVMRVAGRVGVTTLRSNSQPADSRTASDGSMGDCICGGSVFKLRHDTPLTFKITSNLIAN